MEFGTTIGDVKGLSEGSIPPFPAKNQRVESLRVPNAGTWATIEGRLGAYISTPYITTPRSSFIVIFLANPEPQLLAPSLREDPSLVQGKSCTRTGLLTRASHDLSSLTSPSSLT